LWSNFVFVAIIYQGIILTTSIHLVELKTIDNCLRKNKYKPKNIDIKNKKIIAR